MGCGEVLTDGFDHLQNILPVNVRVVQPGVLDDVSLQGGRRLILLVAFELEFHYNFWQFHPLVDIELYSIDNLIVCSFVRSFVTTTTALNFYNSLLLQSLRKSLLDRKSSTIKSVHERAQTTANCSTLWYSVRRHRDQKFQRFDPVQKQPHRGNHFKRKAILSSPMTANTRLADSDHELLSN